jgi:hypothetical protein
VLSVVGILVVVSLVFPIWSSQRWNGFEPIPGATVEVNNQVFDDATYLRVNAHQRYAISNGGAAVAQLQSLTDLYFLNSQISLATSGDMTASQLRGNITPSRTGFPWNLYVWFDYKYQYDAENIVSGIMYQGPAFLNGNGPINIKAKELFSAHPKMLIVVDNNFPTQYSSPYGIGDAVFLTELRNAQTSDVGNAFLPSYMVYQSERVTTYVIDLSP